VGEVESRWVICGMCVHTAAGLESRDEVDSRPWPATTPVHSNSIN
jgi:hypothetical protein